MFDKILQRLTRIFKLDSTVFSEIEHDPEAMTEAAIVVVVAAFLNALGAGVAGTNFFGTFFVTLIIGVLVGWLLWSWLTMFIGTRLFGGEADFQEMARTLGYAYAPQALGVLGILGACVGGIAGLVAFALQLYLGFLAVREALDIPSDKAILTIIISWVVVVVVNIILGIIGLGGVFLAGAF
jgi:hypothetical protein